MQILSLICKIIIMFNSLIYYAKSEFNMTYDNCMPGHIGKDKRDSQPILFRNASKKV